MSHTPGEFGQRIIAFDYDGTLHPNVWPDHEEPHSDMAALVEKLKGQGYRVLVHTARWSIDAPAITDNVGITEVHTGKPVADLYVDDKGLLPRVDLLDAYIEQYFETQVDYLHKLTSGQLTSAYAQNIANVPENPAYVAPTDDGFRVYVPLTGGMDSTTLWQMALEAGQPAVPVYMDFGQPYAEQEIEVASALAARTGHTLVVFRETMPFKQFDYILLARNAAVIYRIAEHARTFGTWGEVWFGNLAGESPIQGGDKSRRFFNDTQALLALRGYDLRICNPLIGMDKPDEVAYWRSRDIDTLIHTKSCFSVASRQCGECQTCFRKWVAFKEHGIDIRDTFARRDIRIGFNGFIQKYKDRMGQARAHGDYSHYSPVRIETTLRAIAALEREW
jgi:7-cyano-7-deazaguanine synthase in queuosine biosynthesis